MTQAPNKATLKVFVFNEFSMLALENGKRRLKSYVGVVKIGQLGKRIKKTKINDRAAIK